MNVKVLWQFNYYFKVITLVKSFVKNYHQMSCFHFYPLHHYHPLSEYSRSLQKRKVIFETALSSRNRDHLLSFIHGCLEHYCLDAPLYGNFSMCIDSF